MTIEQIIHQVKIVHPQANIKLLQQAYDFAKRAHADQLRYTGELYIQHPLHTAFILAQMRVDLQTIIAAILHDVSEDTGHNLTEIKQKFGQEIYSLVEGVTKLSKIRYRGVKRYRESLRKMFLAMTDDLRVILIKFADRLHNLRTLEGVEEKKRLRIAQETLEIYAPIAGLFGIWRLKWQMEDICFKYLYPEEYKQLEFKYEIERKVELNQYIQKVRTIVSKKLTESRIKFSIEGRFKHLYSIWQKMKAKDRAFSEIYDVFALRVVVPTIADCYNVLGIIHTLWKPNYSRFKDYIAVPKPNGYRSLHTTVFGPEGKATEFQIRTPQMNEESLYGIAAHLYYKQSDYNAKAKPIKWMQEILEIQREHKNTSEFIQQVKLHVFQDRIFVFTPKGDVYDLPRGATPVDFAYAVHSDLGNKCSTALINNKIAKLDKQLKNGDLVEIIIEPNRKGPSYEWLKFVKTKKARDKIKQQAKRFGAERFRRFIPGLNLKR